MFDVLLSFVEDTFGNTAQSQPSFLYPGSFTGIALASMLFSTPLLLTALVDSIRGHSVPD